MESVAEYDWIRFTDNEINQSLSRILEHKQATTQFENLQSNRAHGKIFDKDFPSCRIKNGLYNECTFTNLSIPAVTFNGAIFNKTTFDNAIIENTSLQSCNFAESRFANSKLSGSNMSQSFFWRTDFIDTSVFGTTLLQSVMTDCTLNSCVFKSVSFESCILSNLHFSNMRLADLNMEYAQFISIRSDNVTYPFAQMPYIFGGLEYIFSTGDDISISSRKNNVEKISVDEYHDIMRDLIVVYWSRRDFFPLTHVCQCMGKTDVARESVKHGITFALQSRDYRMLKFYCKQAVTCRLFGRPELRALYREIENISNRVGLAENEYYSYSLHLPEIKQLLLDNSELCPTLCITMFTNIGEDDINKLTVFLKVLDDLLKPIPAHELTKHIEIRHNSDVVIELFTSGTIYAICSVLSLIYLLLVGAADISRLVGVIRNTVHSFSSERRAKEAHEQDMRLKQQEYERIQEMRIRENERHSIEMRLKTLEAQKSELDIEALIRSSAPLVAEGRNRLSEKEIIVIKAIPFISGGEGSVVNREVYNDIYKII